MADQPPDAQCPPARDALVAAALSWYRHQCQFHASPRNLDAGVQLGLAEEVLRACCAQVQSEEGLAPLESKSGAADLLLGDPSAPRTRRYGKREGHE